MSPSAPTLSPQEAKRFYDRFGRKQDSQSFYEQKALDELVSHAAFEEAESVVEIGCGTGKLAARMLVEALPPSASYLGLELSSTMARLSRERMAPFGDRARCEEVDGTLPFPVADASCDRFVACYVFDLLSQEDIRGTLDEAWRCLRPGGLLCVAGLTPGTTTASRLVSRSWAAIHRLRPSLVGGCRPIQLTAFLAEGQWTVVHRRDVVQFGVTSELLIAGKTDAA